MIISVLTRNPGNWEPFEELQISSLPELVSYVKKIALHAYKTTDEDIEVLLKAGYSEDAIFEITLCASVGASLVRLERGLQALADLLRRNFRDVGIEVHR